MEQLPLPTSLAEVEELIRALYAPNAPETISKVQEVLHRLQRSPQGWQLAQSLISNPDNSIKFYAALTLIVKLNRESANLSEDDTKELLQNIVGWTLQSLSDGSGAFVTKKLCSALVTHFIYFSHLWPHCLRQFLYCLDIERSVPVEALDEALETDIIVSKLNRQKLTVAIWFATALVEEIGKTDMNSPKYAQVHDRLIRNGPEVACLLARGFAQSTESTTIDVEAEALSCFQSWILYAQRVSSNVDLLVNPLRELVEPAMHCFGNETHFQPTAELFSDVLSNYSSFFTAAHYDALASLFDSPWAAKHYGELLIGDHNTDGISFGLLMLAYGDAKVQDLMTSTDARSQRFLERLSGLLAANGCLVADDLIFVPALEFWSTFVETMIDSAYSDEEESQSWRPNADQHLKTVVMNCWRKIQWPPVEHFAEWDSTERAGFSDARKDVADMLQSIFTLNGVSLISFFVGLFLQSLAVRSWAEVEASAFCLSALSDCTTDDPQSDFELGKVFSSPFFNLLGEIGGPIPLRLRQTGLSLIERYCEYFERHADYLPHALNLLFAAVGDSILGGPSARSISTLCSSCRSILTGEAGAFIRHYQTIRSGQVLDSIAEERIIHAIASIIQAIVDEGQRLQMFEELYTIIKGDFERSLQLKVQPSLLNLSDPNFLRGVEPSNTQGAPSAEDISLQISLRALRCLSSMAKGMQDVKDHIVELEADPRPVSRQGRLTNIQSDIIRLMVEIQRAFNTSGELVEIICNIFRAGFSETEPGPFVFPAEVVTDFFIQQPIDTPRSGTLLSTACSFVGSLYRGPRTFVPSHLARLLPWVITMLQALPEPESDTEIAQNGISFVDRVMPRYPDVLFQLQPSHLLEFFFMFTLKVLNGKEPLPKSAAADFWTGFISIKSEDAVLQTTIANAMDHLGPLIAQTLIQNMGGNAARSELDKLSDPLKKLVTQHVKAQSWLEQALFHESFPSAQVTPVEKMAFLKKVVGLRGARQTNQVVREFWLSCRGSNFTYAS
ncbi:armadillo-type protein [Lasiosphaeria hispida]|uniref:Armadillo-type protein n=1 Tax=Lasiosphaeria hispida TaxID=260671 RepID=A0AAJ0HMN4_9PEZI|nr:armadillo-type protein [Lasiosphaeria hispida]